MIMHVHCIMKCYFFTLIADGINLSKGFLSGRQTPTNFRSVILYILGRHLVHGMKLLWFLKNENIIQGIHLLYVSLNDTVYKYAQQVQLLTSQGVQVWGRIHPWSYSRFNLCMHFLWSVLSVKLTIQTILMTWKTHGWHF